MTTWADKFNPFRKRRKEVSEFKTKNEEITYLSGMLGATTEVNVSRLHTIGKRLVELSRMGSGNSENAVDTNLKLLGFKVKDKVTGFEGVVSSVSFDLYGCIQFVVTPSVDKDGKAKDGRWFDVTRLEIESKDPVMSLPDFNKGYIAEGKKGPAEKPLP